MMGEKVRIWKDTVPHVKVVSLNLRGGTEENYEGPQDSR
jgi:hypothetical protein